MNTPEQLESLEGQQYLVLRPTGELADRFRAEQNDALVLSRLPHPYTGHVTLRGFYEPTRRADLTALVRTWAMEQDPIEMTGEAIDSFPDPWQILILRLARTDSLVSAYATLTERLDATDFHRLGELPLDEWTFHMSVVYGKALSGADWTAIESARVSEFAHPVCETATQLELVSYSNGAERREVIPLGR
ncbi:2'-5' RNA ligase family protein [Microbacterium sp. NPDC008134]|uniref:2'-5' RNA ligase family protein n=1 Tax=Microbacterium sp. NPDC008134 TaxID=3364183 RepID=UPI0036EAE710